MERRGKVEIRACYCHQVVIVCFPVCYAWYPVVLTTIAMPVFDSASVCIRRFWALAEWSVIVCKVWSDRDIAPRHACPLHGWWMVLFENTVRSICIYCVLNLHFYVDVVILLSLILLYLDYLLCSYITFIHLGGMWAVTCFAAISECYSKLVISEQSEQRRSLFQLCEICRRIWTSE